jgi:hypothetical protein
LVSFPLIGGLVFLFALDSSSDMPGDLPPETTTFPIASPSRLPPSARLYFSWT